MKDKDYFVVYDYEYDSPAGNGERVRVRSAHVFTSSATTRWELYAAHLQNRREQCARDGVPWAENPRLAVRTFDAKINKLN